MKVIIPAAGLGTRFASARLGVPKELLPLGGVPLLGHALSEAARSNFEAAVVVVSPGKPEIREFLDQARLPLPVEIVVQPEARGIGDAVLRCWRDDPIAVLLPDDVVLETDHWTRLIQLHRQDGAAALCVRPVDLTKTSRFGIAECDGDRVIGLVEKPLPGMVRSNLAVFGRYIVNESVVAGLRKTWAGGELQLTYGFASAIGTDTGVRAVLFSRHIYDCGTPDEYALSVSHFSRLAVTLD
jgi:UTP--glucose-1-phosphate uridylyltransferase